MIKKAINALLYLFYLYPYRYFLRLFPFETALKIAEPISYFHRIFLKDKCKRALENLKNALGDSYSEKDLKNMVNSMIKNIYRFTVTTFFFDRISRDDHKRLVRIHGLENLKMAMSLQKGAILAFCHNSAYILALDAIGTLEKVNFLIIYEPPDQFHSLAKFFERKRIEFYKLSFGRQIASLKDIFRKLNQGEIVAISFDGIKTDKFLEVPFFNSTLQIPQGVFRISLSTGAPIVPFLCGWLENNSVEACVYKPIVVKDLQEAATELSYIFADHLRRYPTHWHGWFRMHTRVENGKKVLCLSKL